MIKWKGDGYKESIAAKSAENEASKSSVSWDVGRIVDFNLESNNIYIQPTFGCGTADDENFDLFEVNWHEFASKYDAQFIVHRDLFRLGQRVLYWWDRPGAGQLCEDTIMQLDYGADELVYGITGGQKKINKNMDNLKWCRKGAIFECNEQNKKNLSRFISKGFRIPKSMNRSARGVNLERRLFDCIVVGGGMAGLTVKWALNNANKEYKVKILEAQNRIGGRLKPHCFIEKKVCDPVTFEIYNIPRVKVELGAAFLSGSGRDNRFWQWLKRNGRPVCADWGGYNNGWWQRGSFIDTKTG